MKNYVILADACCDLSEQVRKEFDIEDYIPMKVTMSDGRDFKSTLDWSYIRREVFYKTLANNKIQVSTSPLSPDEYYFIFRKYAEQNTDILSISLSSKISSTVEAASAAAERIKKEFPNIMVYCLDSFKMSGGMGLLTMYAHKMKNEGKSIEEVIAWLEENKHRVHQMGPIDDLIFIARRGRITMGKAVMGSFAGVKPMGDCNYEGYVTVLTKIKGMNKALDVTVRYVERMAEDIKNQFVLISHSDRQAYAEKLKSMLEEKLNVQKVYVSDVFAVCGTNIGPGMVGVYFIGPKISGDMSFEKNVMKEVLNG